MCMCKRTLMLGDLPMPMPMPLPCAWPLGSHSAVQEYVVQQYEDLLPYEDFSLRLTNDDLPRLREILRGISDQQYRRLLAGVKAFHTAFSWRTHKGGQAFEFTIASLRRRHHNYKSTYYPAIYYDDSAVAAATA